uniref:F-box protein 40 n=1 Tax=Cyprinodon variegatus TaxID=28743 RepID=A0A3Q2CXR0_CYPVA
KKRLARSTSLSEFFLGHLHCDSCYSRRCRARVEVGVSCALAPCRLLCGAVYHLCKEEDHLLLCPNVRVPCLNAEYGCMVQLPRSSRAAHLQVCPASVVSCSMEWLRWPIDETNPHGFSALQHNIMKGDDTQGNALDVAMALVDQSDLYTRLQMKPLYPELTEPEQEEIKEEIKEDAAVGGFSFLDQKDNIPGSSMCESNSVDETAQSNVTQTPTINTEKYNLFEMMFSMEKRACAVAQENLENPKQDQNPAEEGRGQRGADQERQKKAEADSSAAARSLPPPDTSKTGLAPWQEGVLERLGQELTPQEYNMYMVHQGRMLITFQQIEACTPREKDFVYGSLEPIPVQTLRSFKAPVSYRYKRRVHYYETTGRAKTEHQSVDTSDLGANEEDWFSDEAAATLLGYAELAIMGHKISETNGGDGFYVDIGTQTHTFRKAPFKQKTTLAEVMVDRPLKLLLQLQAESVNSRNNRASCAFTFLCGHTFHRREFATHFRYCLLSFQEHPSPAPRSKSHEGERDDWLSLLPYEVLCHVASFLDSLSLSQLALVSHLMRQVCSSLLQDRGMVTLRWERTNLSHGQDKWISKPVWEFSHLFSAVDKWEMADLSSLSAHLTVCPYYQKTEQRERVPLPFITEIQQRSPKDQSLLNHFTGRR